MAEYIIDENLPQDLPIWCSGKFVHVIDIPGCITDSHIWKYAINHNLIILTKDTIFTIATYQQSIALKLSGLK